MGLFRQRVTGTNCLTSSASGVFIIGALCGSALMYLLDPEKGHHRRKMLGGKVRGMVGNAGKSSRRPDEGHVAEDQVLIERVRSQIGHVISYPKDIEIYASSGRILVSGRISEDEAEILLECVRGVKGVTEVDDDLEITPNDLSRPPLDELVDQRPM